MRGVAYHTNSIDGGKRDGGKTTIKRLHLKQLFLVRESIIEIIRKQLSHAQAHAHSTQAATQPHT